MPAAVVKRRSSKAAPTALRYAAKLLFQFRVMKDGQANKRRLCEEQIVVINADDAQSALREAKRRGRAGRLRYKNPYGNMVFVEFVGVLDLKRVETRCDDGEVWYEFRYRLRPMERREKLIPAEHDLTAIRSGV
jgi:hypothetical protein